MSTLTEAQSHAKYKKNVDWLKVTRPVQDPFQISETEMVAFYMKIK